MPGSYAPAVTVIVAARDAVATLTDTLDGLARQTTGIPYEVVVVDNGSLDGTASLAEGHPSKPRVLRRDRGEGPGAARNDGAAVARGEILAFTDSDCAPAPTWLAEGMQAIAAADLVQGYVRPPPDARRGPFDRTLWVTSEYGLYETANLFVRRAWFERLGGFRDWVSDGGRSGSLSRPFGEDAWFAWRARRMGARTAFAERAVVHHAVFSGTAGGYIAERWRLRHFPELVSRIPELRDGFVWRRLFLSAQTAAFDAGVAGALVAVLLRSWFPLAAAAPYAVSVVKQARGWNRRDKVRLSLVTPIRDALGLVALVAGSIRARAILL